VDDRELDVQHLSDHPSSRSPTAPTVYSVRTEGNSDFIQLNNGTGGFDTEISTLGIRTVANQADLNYQASKWLVLWRIYYSDRLIRSILAPGIPPFDQTSILNGRHLWRAAPAHATVDNRSSVARWPR